MFAIVLPVGCALHDDGSSARYVPPVKVLEPPDHEPIIRVRLGKTQLVTVSATSDQLHLSAGPGAYGTTPRQTFDGPVNLTVGPEGFYLRLQDGRLFKWKTPSIRVEPDGSGLVEYNGVAYHGWLAVHASPPDLKLSVVNHLPMEQYLPGVLAKELYADWPEAAFEAQAVAARTYAVYHWSRRSESLFDVESTTASQAYIGAGAHRRARDAVAATRGVMLLYNGKVIQAFYSSDTGGVGQDAGPIFGNANDIPPLRGRVHRQWGQSSPLRTWGPIDRSITTFTDRLAAWGRANDDPIARLAEVTEVRVAATNDIGRPTRFAIRDRAGKTYTLNAEELRFAANYEGPGTKALAKGQALRSSFVTVTMRPNVVRFEGRGFGHGVGMGQWQAHDMAKAGKDWREIIGFFYPGAQVSDRY